MANKPKDAPKPQPLSADEREALRARLPSLEALTEAEKVKLAAAVRAKRTGRTLISSERVYPKVSNAPPPVMRVSGLGASAIPRRAKHVEPVDWPFWRLQTYVKDWEAAALSIGINPDSLRHHAGAWMAGSARAIFEAQSFTDAKQKLEFDKRYRLAETWGKNHGDKVRYFNSGEVDLSGFAAWLTANDVEVPSEFRMLVGASTGKDPEPAPSQASAEEATSLRPAETETQYPSKVLAELFDPVGTAALEKMFPSNPRNPTETKWKKWAERASDNGLITARTERAKFNPVLAAEWWLKKQNPDDWDWSRCRRRLASNLPERSKEFRNLVIDEP